MTEAVLVLAVCVAVFLVLGFILFLGMHDKILQVSGYFSFVSDKFSQIFHNAPYIFWK